MPSETEKKESYCPHCSAITTQSAIKGSLKWKCRKCEKEVSGKKGVKKG